jgi:hemerythrin-like metal-binding protein
MTTRIDPTLACGFEELDAQHRTLLDRVDAAAAAALHDDLAGTRAALADLRDALAEHFTAEESFMAATSYPERGRHKSAHDLFMQDFAQLGRELELAGLSPPNVQWITTRVTEWVKFHIQVNDLPLGRFLASRRFRPEQASGAETKPRA